MDIHEKLRKAGFNPPPKPNKVDSKKANMGIKVVKAKQFLKDLEKYNQQLSSVSDKDTFVLVSNSVVLSYERLCESIKDILNIIAVKENISNLSDKRGLGELIRSTSGILNISASTEKVIKTLTTRNDIVHDYINSEYYDEQIVIHVENSLEEYKKYLNCIIQYLQTKNMIQ